MDSLPSPLEFYLHESMILSLFIAFIDSSASLKMYRDLSVRDLDAPIPKELGHPSLEGEMLGS